jgi:hypothetical protein
MKLFCEQDKAFLIRYLYHLRKMKCFFLLLELKGKERKELSFSEECDHRRTPEFTRRIESTLHRIIGDVKIRMDRCESIGEECLILLRYENCTDFLRDIVEMSIDILE